MTKRTVIVLLGGFCLAGATAGPAPGLKPIGTLQEHFEREVKVSGATLAGLGWGEVGGTPDIRRLAADLPAVAKGKLCVSISTRDGRYSALQDYELQGPRAGANPLGLSSSHDLRQYAPGDFAVKVQLRDDCGGGAARAYLPSRWDPPRAGEALTVMLNVKSARASAQLLDAAGGALLPQPVSCAEVKEGARTVFDHVCRLPVDRDLATRAVRLQLSISGRAGGRPRPESFPIMLAK